MKLRPRKNKLAKSPAVETHIEIDALVRQLHLTVLRLNELTNGEVDSVVNPAGDTYLLQKAQHQLRQSEQRQRESAAIQASIMNALPAHIALLDHEGAIRSVNEGWERFSWANSLDDSALGIGENYLAACDRARERPDEGPVEAAAGIRAVLAEEVPNFDFEYRSHTPLGRRWFRLIAQPLKANGLCGAVIMHMDITASKLAEEEKRESQEFFRLLVEGVQDYAIFMLNQTGHVVSWNAGAERIKGYKANEIIGKHFSIFYCPEDVQEGKPAQQLALAKEHGHFESEGWRVRIDGTQFWANIVITALHDERGHLRGYAKVARDLTARKLAQEDQQRRQIELQTLFDLMPAMLCFKDTKNTFLRVNKRMADTTGRSVQDMEGKSAFELFPDDAAKYYADDLEVINSGEAKLDIVETMRDGQGRERVVRTSKVPVKDETGEAIALVVMAQDITEMRKLETQFLRAQRMECVGTLAGGIAHDLNNILSPILICTALMRSARLLTEVETIIPVIEASVRRGTDVVRQLLIFGRGEETQSVPLQVRHLLREMVDLVRKTFPKNLTINFRLPNELWIVLGDATHLHQVLLNLCVNARDAMPEGGTLMLKAQNIQLDDEAAKAILGAKAGHFVKIEVSDTGTGMSPETMAKVFEPFFTTKPIGQGTGLGLSTVLGIVKGHGGFIDFQSELGRGTKFEIYLPAIPDAVESAPLAPDVADVRSSHDEWILLVDDEPAILKVTRMVLEKQGYVVMTAVDGLDALEKFASNIKNIKGVVTDLMMPRLDGLGLVEGLKKMDPNVKVIVTSGSINDIRAESKIAALKAMGISQILTKPYSADALLKLLQETLHPTPQ